MADETIIPAPSNLNISEGELQTVRDVMKSLCLALKSCALYPEGHSSLQKSIARVTAKLDTFFQTYGSLRLTVAKEELIYCHEVVHNDNTDGETIAFPLFRDGIQWLEFQQGFSQNEVPRFLKVINKYSTIGEEAEGDIATALYDNNFNHLSYDAKNIFWEGEPLLDFSSSGIAPTAEDEEFVVSEEDEEFVITEEDGEFVPDEAGKEVTVAPRIKEVLPQSIADPTRDRTLWEMTPEEKSKLEEMVLHEENWDATKDVLDVLLVILSAQNSEKDFSAVLDFTKEELQETLIQGAFALANNLLKNLLSLSKTTENRQEWYSALINKFFQDISGQEFLAPVMEAMPALDGEDEDRRNILRQSLLFLSPKAILSLGPALLQIKSAALQKTIMEVIGTMALRDISPLLYLLDQAEERLAEKLIFILGYIKGEETTKILNKMIHHPSKLVRNEALSTLIKRDPETINKLFPLIDDPASSVRNSFLNCLGLQRSTSSENRLLLYIEQKQFLKKDDQHIIACYKALGGCGSAKSISFLKNILLGQTWNTFVGFGKLVHRQGAAAALLSIKTEETHAILVEASQSKNPMIQQAVKLAVKENHG